MGEPDDKLDALIQRLQELADSNEYLKHGGRKRMAEQIGVPYQHLWRILHKLHKPNKDTIERIEAFFSGNSASVTVARAVRSAPAPNLSICLAYHGERWPPYVIAAAKAGAFSTDVPANAWPLRLDALKQAIEACAENEAHASAAILKK